MERNMRVDKRYYRSLLMDKLCSQLRKNKAHSIIHIIMHWFYCALVHGFKMELLLPLPTRGITTCFQYDLLLQSLYMQIHTNALKNNKTHTCITLVL